MSTLPLEIPDSIKQSIEEVAAKQGCSASQFVVNAAAEKAQGERI